MIMDKGFEVKYKNKVLRLGSKTRIMGVLNVTPDSFSDGGVYYDNVTGAVERARQMLEEGANIIDVGGQSTRPGSEAVTVKEELDRVIPVIRKMRSTLGDDFWLSIDTQKAKVAQQALLAGADMINSLSGFDFDKDMVQVVRKFKCPIIIYHIKGNPKTMQKGAISYKDVVKEVYSFFESQVAIAKKNGIGKNQLLIDPGIGFGKSLEQNMELIREIDSFSGIKVPIVVGVSRKSHLGTLLKEALDLDSIPISSDRLEAALAETSIAVTKGANIIRTHDVWQTKRFVASLDKLVKTGKQ